MWPFKFKGMIKPEMAMTFDDAKKVSDRKSIEMVQYLRARQGMSDALEYRRKSALRYKQFHRARYFSLIR